MLEATGRGSAYEKGLCLRPPEYSTLKEFLPEIGKVLPELDAFVPCYMQSDHMNQGHYSVPNVTQMTMKLVNMTKNRMQIVYTHTHTHTHTHTMMTSVL